MKIAGTDLKTFKFTIGERLTLLSLLPDQGNYLTLGLIRNFRDKLVFTEDDIKKFGIVEGPGEYEDSKGIITHVPEGKMVWDFDLDKGVDFEIGPKLFEVIYKILDDAEKKNLLKVSHISIFEKIVLPKREAEEAEKAKK